MSLRDDAKALLQRHRSNFNLNNTEIPEETPTLNEQVSSGRINLPQLESHFNKTLNQQVEDWSINTPIMSDNNPDTFSAWFLNPTENNTNKTAGELVDAARRTQEKEEQWIFKRLWGWIKNIPSGVENSIRSQYADSEAQAKEKNVAMGYDKKSWDVLYLDLNEDRWLFDWTRWQTRDGTKTLFEAREQEYFDKINTPGITQAEEAQALSDFYNSTKKLFRLRADDYYSDWFVFNDGWKAIWRRRDNYTDEQLEGLASNNLKKWYYEPEFEEWLDYINVRTQNQQQVQDIYSWYGIASDDEDDVIDLSPEAFSKWKQGYSREVNAWVLDTINQYITNKNPNTRNDVETMVYSAQEDQWNRLWTILQPVYAAEQVILAKPENERTDWEKETLKSANLFRQMERAAARGLNEVIIEGIKNWVNDKGELVDFLQEDYNWRSLSDVLSWEVKRLSWMERDRSDSIFDVFQKMANDALYNYHRWKWSLGTQAWRWVQNWLAPAWMRLGEVWQQAAKKVWELNNIIYYWTISPVTGLVWSAYDIVTWQWDIRNPLQWRNTLADKLTWKSMLSPTWEALDQDFTIWRLFNTEDWNIKRTVKKYLLQWAEYVPEVAWNLVPDILITAATSWVWAVSMLRNIPKAARAIKTAKWLSTLQKLREAWNVMKWGLRWVEWLQAWINWIKNVNQTWKTVGELADRAITQSVIDQAMDAQWSGFDTEAYSGLSEVLSVFGTLGMNFLPAMSEGDVISWIKKFANKNAITKSIWDVSDYMSSSPEAAENIARALNKTAPEIGLDDLRTFARNFWEIEDAAKTAYQSLPPEWQQAANRWTKQLMYDYINQTFGSNSEVAKRVRLILNNGSTNAADIIKYIWKIPWEVSFWPYVSTIRLKQWTQADALVRWSWYNTALDSIPWWFDSKLRNWFTEADIEDISKIKWFASVMQDKDKLFYTLDGKRYLTLDGVERFWLRAENASLETIWISLKDAENVRELFKERMKGLTNKNISDTTVDRVADSWAYEEILEKVREVMC